MRNPINKVDFDVSVRPQDDFYQYVNGGWFKKNTIPPSENRWGSFFTLMFKNKRILHGLIKDLVKKKNVKKGSDSQKLIDLYLSSMDMRRRNQQGISYLFESFEIIDSLTDRKKMAVTFAYLHLRGVDAPWSLWIDQDDKNSKRMVLRIGQGGLGVPDRNYYTKKDKESVRIKSAYEKYVRRTLSLEKYYKKSEIEKVTKVIIRIEKRLAKSSMTPVERRNVHAMYNKYTLLQLKTNFPVIDWNQYFNLLRVPLQARKHIIVDQPIFLKEVNALLRDVSLSDLKIYLRWHFLDTYTGALGEDFVDASFQYNGKAIQGLEKLSELWKRSVSAVNMFTRDTLGQLYVKEYFSVSSKRTMTRLVRNLTKAYSLRLQELDWMSEKTRKKAIKKLEAMSLQLGYPKKWQSYKKLRIDRESYVKNVMEGMLFEFNIAMQKLDKPTDPDDWDIPAQMVNAFYSPNLNQIIFPAAILQPPLFYSKADDAVNYGAIGAVIGHEMTHGFDDSGSLFDENGNLKNWWTKKDRSHFIARAKTLEKQFNKYRIVDDMPVSGKLTLGENIADLGGLMIAYHAFRLTRKNKKQIKINGLTPNQRFFISYALSERCLVRDEYAKFAVLNDTHAPEKFRSNGPVSNSEDFYAVFNVTKNDALYRSPNERVRIW